MRKIALLVEGQTELIFVRDYLNKYFDWSIEVLCVKIRKYDSFPVPYDTYNPSAALHFQIIDVGGGAGLLSYAAKNVQRLANLDYEKIICLCDMYDEQYKQIVGKKKMAQQIDEETNQVFYEEKLEAIAEMNAPIKIIFCFAIMEIEAWLLGKIDVWKRLDARLSEDAIAQIFEHDKDPEKTLFHPSNQIKQIMQSIDKQYNKHEAEIESIMSVWQKEDYESLALSDNCSSFTLFHSEIIN